MYTYGCFACMFVCLLYGYYAHGGQKRASLGLELQITVSHYEGAGNRIWVRSHCKRRRCSQPSRSPNSASRTDQKNPELSHQFNLNHLCKDSPPPHPKGNIHRAMTRISLRGIMHVLSKSQSEEEKGWGLYLTRPAIEPTVRKPQIKVYRTRVKTGLKSRFIPGWDQPSILDSLLITISNLKCF